MALELDAKQFEITERLNTVVNTVETHILNYNLKLRLDKAKSKKQVSQLVAPTEEKSAGST